MSEVRKRLRQVIDEARRVAASRRSRAEQAGKAYDAFLAGVAAPVFQMLGVALRAEGLAFTVFTPAGGLRLMSERSSEDFIELELDASAREPVVIGRVSRRRGGRVTREERPIREDASIEALTDEDVLRFLMREIEPFVER